MRFPRNEAVWQRCELERFVLSQLNLPNVQKIVRASDDPPYLELTYLQGEHMSEEEFRQLPIQKQKVVGNYTLPTPAQDKIAKRYLKAWQSIRPSKPVVVHDDLHMQNLLFCDGKIAGVIDFGAVCIGTAEQGLRQVYRLSSEALDAAIAKYDSLAHTKLSAETARIWAITQELAAYSRELQSKAKTSAFQRSREHLALWFPGVF